MRIVGFAAILGALVALVVGVRSTVDSTALAQGRSNDPNVLMLDNCSDTDPAYDALGGCPEGTHPSLRAHRGNVSRDELFDLLTSPLAPLGHIVGHPSWRNEPSYITIRAGQSVRVWNRGGRVHTFTEVQDFGGGFVPPLNAAWQPAPECGANFTPHPSVTFVGVGESQQLAGLGAGLHKFQCCIHPWMRAAIRVQ